MTPESGPLSSLKTASLPSFHWLLTASTQDQCAGHQRQKFPEVLSIWPQEPLLPHLPTGVCGQLDWEQLPGDSPAGG